MEKFGASGGFILAFGREVDETTGGGVCTAASGDPCKQGVEGAEPGELGAPTFVAVDESTGDVYVADTADRLVSKFSSEGALVAGWGNNGAGGGANGQLNGSPGEPFNILAGIATDSAGDLWVYDENGEMREFGPDGGFLTEWNSGYGVTDEGIALDPVGNLYVVRGSLAVEKFSPAGGDEGEVDPSGTATALAIDSGSGDLYVAVGNAVNRFHSECSAPCGVAESFGAGNLESAAGIAVNAGAGDVYVSDPLANEIKIFSAATVPDAVTGAADGAETIADLQGSVNPDGLPVSGCKFEYGPDAGYGASEPCDQSPTQIGAGSTPVTVSAQLSGLQPRTQYHFRLVARNANGQNDGQDGTFTTFSRPVIGDVSAHDILDDRATLSARLNPGGRPTTYRFEYGPSESYGNSLPLPDGDAGKGLEDVSVSAQPQGLAPATTYHYRLVAVNDLGETRGEDRTFTTEQLLGGPLNLPDSREWELVSPSNKHNGSVQPLLLEGAVQAAAEGTGFTFISDQTLFAEAQGAPTFAQVLARRTPAGWTSEDIATPHDAPVGQGVGQGQEYRAFSPDLSHALVEPFGPFTPLSPEASERTPYLRDDGTGSYLPLLTAANTPPGTVFGGVPSRSEGAVHYVSAAPDWRSFVIQTEGRIPLSSEPDDGHLYEWKGGELRPVSVVPDGTSQEVESDGLGGEGVNVRHAISTDGSRVFWSGQQQGERHLWVREMDAGETVQIDAAEAGASGEGINNPQFQDASKDGSIVFFTDEAQLTADADAGIGHSDLYECKLVEAAGQTRCQLEDLTPPESGEAAEVKGAIPGSSEDGSTVYFVANGVLSRVPNEAGETAVSGNCSEGSLEEQEAQRCNLYVERGGTTRLVAVLSGADAHDWGGGAGVLRQMTARVSPDGRWLAFMSERPLTGYDNRDAISGRPDQEVFLFDAEAAPSLICASCDPTGARPQGTQESQGKLRLVDHSESWEERWLAADLPIWETLDGHATSTYQPRYLSNSGRLFFNAASALVPGDVNEQWDVYQYEPAGTSSGCAETSQGFLTKDAGCIDLLSSGTSSGESAFLDASESGGDVFFLTGSRLNQQDRDSQLDVYDAHACTWTSPCLPGVQGGPPPSPCTSAESCHGPTARPPALEVPASATFHEPRKQKRTRSRAQRLARALKACDRKPRPARKKCRAIAKKHYGGAGDASARAKGRFR
ncbi:MAG: hypothetical protein ACTHO8_05165 [Solirubrobacterales bacterium]